jgi:catechol 2,3-dioxygenase-like lactoylglutathione lyase family enzyme
MDIRPDHADMSVGDLETAIAWYRDMLGFEPARVATDVHRLTPCA